MTWPGCQNRKCTYVNNSGIRSRNIRIITLTVDGLNECNCDAHEKVDVELLYNSVKTGSQLVWKPDQLVIRCGRENQHPERLCPPSPRLSSPGERERNAVMANRVGVNMLQFCSVSNSLSHTTISNKMRGIFFSKRLCRSSLLLCRPYDSACTCRRISIMCLYSWSWFWLYNTWIDCTFWGRI